MKKLDAGTSNFSRVVRELGRRNLEGVKQNNGDLTTQATTTTTTTTTTTPSKALLSAQKVVLGQVEQRAQPKTVATQSAEIAGKLADGGGVRSFFKTAVAAAMMGFAMLSSPGLAKADTIFLDHNDAPMEISVAKKLAASLGEKFILVRPNSAALDSVFAKAERGEIDARHLILSGHSSGQRVWGQGGDGTHHETSMEEFKDLKAKYPKAFQQVKHVHFMSCYAGSAGNSAQWSAVFPDAKIAGFWGSGPAKTQPAAQLMLKNSELSMRKLDGRNLSPTQALIAAKQMAQQPGSVVTKFAVRLPTNDGASVHFALGDKATPVDVAADRVDVLRARVFDNFMSPVGQDASFASPPRTHAQSPLRDYYNALHTYLNALPADDYSAPGVRNDIDVTIRLIYFDVIQAKMQANHGATFAAADSVLKSGGATFAIGDVSKLSRVQVLQLVDKMEQAGDAMSGQPPAAFELARKLLDQGLKQLSPDVVPSTWIE